ncbi:MAG: 50S ribosomal protein L25 [Planctomycetota bacterium]|nr:50S ribosomal protein L25 [Planctomycetota bacterium]
MEKMELMAELRKHLGKADAKRLRRSKKIPAVVYGRGTQPIHITVLAEDVNTMLQKGVKLIELDVGGEKHHGVLQDVQIEPISGNVIHLDFHKVALSDKIHIEVPVEIFGQPKCLPSVGVLERHLDKVKVECLASDIPKSFIVDVRELDVGGMIKISDLKVPAGVRILEKAEEIVVSVTRAMFEEEKPVEAEVGEVAEPEVVERRKKEEEAEEEK